MIYLLLFALISFSFYFLIPGIGAFLVRKNWRRFRSQMLESTHWPFFRYGYTSSEKEGYLGNFRFLGTLEAIQGDDTIWIRGAATSVSAQMRGGSVYLLPSYASQRAENERERNAETLPEESPTRIGWEKVYTLNQGAKIFLAGPVYLKKGTVRFMNERQRPLTVVLYEGDERTMLRRAIWGGRQKNEYWNQFTPGSVAAGSFLLLILSYILLRSPFLRSEALIGLVLSLLPAVIFLPPGVLFFFLYRRFWKRARLFRRERDLLRLPLRYFSEDSTVHKDQLESERDCSAPLPEGGRYVASRAEKRELEELIQSERVKIRGSTLVQEEGQHYVVFLPRGEPEKASPGSSYSPSETAEQHGIGGEHVPPPLDPMVERIAIPTEPAGLADACARRAKWNELASAAFLIIDLAVNIPLILFGLSRLIW